MNRINQLFQDSPKNLLSIYFCAGCPTLEGTVDVIRTLERNGVHSIEIGIPSVTRWLTASLWGSCHRALRNGMSLRILFEQLRDIVAISVFLSSWWAISTLSWNSGSSFLSEMRRMRYRRRYYSRSSFKDYEERINLLPTVTSCHHAHHPETSEARVREIDEHTDGFIYMVSSAATPVPRKISIARSKLISKRYGITSAIPVWLASASVTNSIWRCLRQLFRRYHRQPFRHPAEWSWRRCGKGDHTVERRAEVIRKSD